eukprot:COSAG01_NODE_5562_length_4179_cov_8.225514_2_plen_98_part_00
MPAATASSNPAAAAAAAATTAPPPAAAVLLQPQQQQEEGLNSGAAGSVASNVVQRMDFVFVEPGPLGIVFADVAVRCARHGLLLLFFCLIWQLHVVC